MRLHNAVLFGKMSFQCSKNVNENKTSNSWARNELWNNKQEDADKKLEQKIIDAVGDSRSKFG